MNKKKRIPKEISIAKYGLLGTLATASCSVIGAFLAAYFGYLGITTQIKEPIAATATAEARLASLPASTVVSTTTPRKVTPTPTPLAIKDIVRIESFWNGCPAERPLPDYIDPNQDIDEANNQFQVLLTKEGQTDNHLSSKWRLPYYSFTLTGLSSNQEWITLDKKISIYVHKRDVPEHLNMVMMGGCGGELELREFPQFYLDADHETYMIEETYPDPKIVGFTLMPGEPEEFHIPITCKAPGIYDLEITMKAKYSGQIYEIRLPLPSITCPKSFTRWDTMRFRENPDLTFTGNYEWDGDQYIAVPLTKLTSITVAEIKFFESGKNLPDIEQRLYDTRFSQETTRFIAWELHLKYPPAVRPINFVIHAVYYRSNGEIKSQQDRTVHVLAGWDNSFHAAGWGSSDVGTWEKDTYTVVISIDGIEVGEASFIVD